MAGAGGQPCQPGAVCDESFAQASPWLLLLSFDGIAGLPTAELGKRELIKLGQRKTKGILVGPEALRFSPDGRHALITYLAPDIIYELLELSFGHGVPEAMSNVPNLPRLGAYELPTFSPGSTRALASESGTEYLLDMSGETTVASLPESPTLARYGVTFCDGEGLFGLDNAELRAELQASSGRLLSSPDARTVLVRSAETRLVHCDAQASGEVLSTPFQDVSFSPDSRHLLLNDGEGSVSLLSISQALATAELFRNDNVWLRQWVGGHIALMAVGDPDEPSGHAYLDLSEQPVMLHPLPLPAGRSYSACNEAGCVALVPGESPGKLDLERHSFETPSQSTIIAAGIADDASVQIELDLGWVLLTETVGDGGRLSAFKLGESPDTARMLFDWSVPSTIEKDIAPDGSGVVVRQGVDLDIFTYWAPLTGAAEQAAAILLDVQAHTVQFQPWP